jgi:hypothetical protein
VVVNNPRSPEDFLASAATIERATEDGSRTTLLRVAAETASSLRQDYGLVRDAVREQLKGQFTDLSDYELTAALAMSHAHAVAAPSPAALPDTLPSEAPPEFDANTFSNEIYGTFGKHAHLPQEEVAKGKALIPTILAEFCWLFTPSRHPSHSYERDGTSVVIGGARDKNKQDEEFTGLVMQNQRLLLCLYLEAQTSGMSYAMHGGRRYLRIETTARQVHRLFYGPDSPYGGSWLTRLFRYLDELRDTKVVFKPAGTQSRFLAPFIQHWERQGDKIVVCLHWRWTEAFTDPERKQLKPLWFNEYNILGSAYARLIYLHSDWATSHAEDGESRDLAILTILERAGAFHEECDDGNGSNTESQRKNAQLRNSPSKQSARVQAVARLNGAILSSGEVLQLDIEPMRSGNGLKIVMRKAAQLKLATDSILRDPIFRRAHESWANSPRQRQRLQPTRGP